MRWYSRESWGSEQIPEGQAVMLARYCCFYKRSPLSIPSRVQTDGRSAPTAVCAGILHAHTEACWQMTPGEPSSPCPEPPAPVPSRGGGGGRKNFRLIYLNKKKSFCSEITRVP